MAKKNESIYYTSQNEYNLNRTNYYFLLSKKLHAAKQIILDEKRVFLHKSRRGFSSDKFTHMEMCSFLKIIALKYINLYCTNLAHLLKHANSVNFIYTTTINDEEEEGNGDDSVFGLASVSNDPTSLFLANRIKKQVDPFFYNPLSFKFVQPILKPRNGHDIRHSISFNEFCRFMGKQLGNESICNILNIPLTCIFQELSIKYKFYKIHKNLDLYLQHMQPKVYDYLITLKILNYIKQLN